MTNEYASVVRMLTPVLGRGRAFDPNSVPEATPLAREIAYGVLRDWFRLDAIAHQLLKKPLAESHIDVRILLLAGIYSVARHPAACPYQCQRRGERRF
ncbi:MAG: hypothetical protein U5O39_18880 [Gammaproteobacteria bacterium]|nr:hypothetical protein [Gammaproteobacteria bacterium]